MLSEETLRTSEIEFLRNIDLKGVHQDQNERRISIINNQIKLTAFYNYS